MLHPCTEHDVHHQRKFPGIINERSYIQVAISDDILIALEASYSPDPGREAVPVGRREFELNVKVCMLIRSIKDRHSPDSDSALKVGAWRRTGRE